MAEEQGQEESKLPATMDLGYEKDPALENGAAGRPTMVGRRRRSNLPELGLVTDRFSMRIPANHDAHHTAAKTHGYDHWCVKLLNFIHSEQVQMALMILLLLDVVILFIELFLSASYPVCHTIERDAISCCAPVNTTEGDHGGEGEHFRWLEGDSEEGHHNLCHYPSVESHDYEATCDPHKYQNVHTLEKVLFWCTISILCIFLIELMALIVALRKAFFRQFFYVLDLWIVATSLALEITFAVLHEDALVAITGILVFGRVWRFVRIGHGLIEVTSEYASKDKKVLLDYAESLERLLQDNDVDLPEKSDRIQKLEKSLTHHGSNVGGGHGEG